MEESKNNAIEKVEEIAGEKTDENFMRQITPERREEIRAERRIALAKLREETKAKKQEKRLEMKLQRQKNRQKNREEGRVKSGLVVAVITLGLSTLILATVLTFNFLMPSEKDTTLENLYQRSFYDTVERVDNIDLNLSKILATKDSGSIQGYLVDVAINSELAESDLSELPLQDESKFYTTKLVNQIGDYAKYLNKKLANGERLSSEDVETLKSLYNANLTFKQYLQKTVDKMNNDYSFSSMLDGGDGNLVINNFNELQNMSVSYPELIYDGPFSDGLNERKIKGLTGAEINEDRAVEIFNELFSGLGLTDVKSVGETTGKFALFNVQANIDKDVVYAQISKTGGKLVMYSYAGSCKDTNIDQADAIVKATDFLVKAKIEGVSPVWINLSENVYTINFAYETDGVICYPDMVKIRVCAETGMVIGFEGSSYYINHVDRVIKTPALSEKQCQGKVSDNINVDSCRLALVPFGNSSEILCYEFSGEYDGSIYYAYIDANTGRQVQLFKVLEGTEGSLLM